MLRFVPQLRLVLLPALFAAGALAAGLLAFWVAGLPGEQRDAARLVAHSLDVLRATSTLEADLATLSSEGRGFVVDRTTESRTRFDIAAGSISIDLARLAAITADNPEQVAALDELRPLIEARIANLQGVVAMLVQGDDSGAIAQVTSHQGRAVADHVAVITEGIRLKERRLLDQRAEASQKAAGMTAWAVFIGTLIVAGSAAATLAVLVRRQEVRRRADQLTTANATLERRVAERTAELAASMAEQQAYFDHAPVGLVVLRRTVDGPWIVENLNPAAGRILGLTRSGMIGLPLRDAWPHAEIEAAANDLDRSGGVTATVPPAATLLASETAQQLDVELVSLIGPAGKVRRVLVCVRDLTEQRRLERQVVRQFEHQAAAAERELALFRNSPDTTFIVRVDECDGELRFVYEACSPAIEALTGLPPAQLIGRRLDECLPPHIARSLTHDYRRCAQQGSALACAASYETPAGLRDFEGTLAPIRHATTGAVAHLVGSMHDVTERNRLQDMVRHAQKMEAIGKLAAGVAHDFNNILQTVIAALELVLDDVGRSTSAYSYGSLALTTALRGSTLTDHLLSYARKQMLRPAPVALAGFLAEIEQVLSRTLDPNITVRTQSEPVLGDVLVDPAQLETALINLAVNAADAMPEGGIVMLALRMKRSADHDWAVIAVTDTGCGMDAATLARATEPFFTTKGSQGTGLGLSMAQGFAAQSGGNFSIRSAPGCGTTVELHLPVMVAPGGVPARAIPRGDIGPIRVLLVDDNADVLVTVGGFMETAGVTLARAADGDSALLALAGGARFDVLVTDYAMPGLNGADLVELARGIQPGLPAVIITGFIDLARQGAMPAGIVTLHKPFERQALLAAIGAVMGRDWDDLDNLTARAVAGTARPV